MSFRRERRVPVGECVVVPIQLRPKPDTMVPHVTRRPIASPVLGVPLLVGHGTLSNVHRGLVGSNPLADRVVELDDVDVVARSGSGVLRWVLRTALLLRHRAPLFRRSDVYRLRPWVPESFEHRFVSVGLLTFGTCAEANPFPAAPGGGALGSRRHHASLS